MKAKSRRATRGFRRLKVYQLAYQLSLDLFKASTSFPTDGDPLVDQIRRSSRGVASNVAIGYQKRRFERMFVRMLVDAESDSTETQVWIDIAHDLGYIKGTEHLDFLTRYEEVTRMLKGMMEHPERFMT